MVLLASQLPVLSFDLETPANSILDMKVSTLANQFLAGHFPYKNYLVRLNLAPTSEVVCDCGVIYETKTHLLLECHKLHEARIILRASFRGPLDCNSLVA